MMNDETRQEKIEKNTIEVRLCEHDKCIHNLTVNQGHIFTRLGKLEANLYHLQDLTLSLKSDENIVQIKDESEMKDDE